MSVVIELADYRLCAMVTVLVYILNARSGIAVGKARDKFNVPMPKTHGPPEFERVFRAHCNNCEQYPQFLALMWVFAIFCQAPLVAGAMGVFWVVMRNLYVTEYHNTKSETKNVTKYSIPAYMVLTTYSLGILFTVLYGMVVDVFLS